MGHGPWDYITIPERDRERLGELGREGWELTGIGGDGEARLLYLKRPALDFRERVTLDQRRRVYESLGLDSWSAADAEEP